MTAKCLTYAQEQSAKEDTTDSETNDISNEKFWESIHMSFQVALELLYEDARRRGIDPDNLPEVERKKGCLSRRSGLMHSTRLIITYRLHQ
jgi:hypothetical protein